MSSSIINSFPSELLTHIFSLADRHTLKNCQYVSKFWNALLKEGYFWKQYEHRIGKKSPFYYALAPYSPNNTSLKVKKLTQEGTMGFVISNNHIYYGARGNLISMDLQSHDYHVLARLQTHTYGLFIYNSSIFDIGRTVRGCHLTKMASFKTFEDFNYPYPLKDGTIHWHYEENSIRISNPLSLFSFCGINNTIYYTSTHSQISEIDLNTGKSIVRIDFNLSDPSSYIDELKPINLNSLAILKSVIKDSGGYYELTCLDLRTGVGICNFQVPSARNQSFQVIDGNVVVMHGSHLDIWDLRALNRPSFSGFNSDDTIAVFDMNRSHLVTYDESQNFQVWDYETREKIPGSFGSFGDSIRQLKVIDSLVMASTRKQSLVVYDFDYGKWLEQDLKIAHFEVSPFGMIAQESNGALNLISSHSFRNGA